MAEHITYPAGTADSLQLYLAMTSRLNGEKPFSYISGPVTSKATHPGNLPERMAANIEFAQLAIAYLEQTQQLPPDQTIISPFDLGARFFINESGEMVRWQESTFLRFWILMIAGMSKYLATEFDRAATQSSIDFVRFNDHEAPTEERWREYCQLIEVARQCLQAHSLEILPVQAMIQLLGAEVSLGSRLEALLAQDVLHIPRETVVFYPEHPDWSRHPIAAHCVVEYLRHLPVAASHFSTERPDPRKPVARLQPVR
jgi:hypothetical protein